MKKDNLNNKLENDLDILKEIYTVFKLASKYYDKTISNVFKLISNILKNEIL